MSEKIVRFKYKSDIINCIEESWDYYGKEDEQRKVIKELKNVYKIASSAKNAPKHEYEAKVKAFDRIVEELKRIEFDIYEKELIDENRGYLSYGKEISRFIHEYESGGFDD